MQKIRIDFDNPGLPQHISAVENDSQSRFFQATLYENGKAYTAPEGATYSIMYRGFGPQNQGWYDTINDGAGKRAACAVSGNIVTCEIARQALQVPGHVSIVLCVTTGKGYMLKSWPIECDCKNDRYDSTAEIQSFFYITQVSNADWTQAIQAWENLKDTIDPTLSVSGKAADAAKVGEAVNAEAERAKGVEGQIKEEITDFFDFTSTGEINVKNDICGVGFRYIDSSQGNKDSLNKDIVSFIYTQNMKFDRPTTIKAVNGFRFLINFVNPNKNEGYYTEYTVDANREFFISISKINVPSDEVATVSEYVKNIYLDTKFADIEKNIYKALSKEYEGNLILATNTIDGKIYVDDAVNVDSIIAVGKNLFDISKMQTIGATEALYLYSIHCEPNTYYTCSTNIPHSDIVSLYFGGSNTEINGVFEDKPVTAFSSEDGTIPIFVRYEASAGGVDAYNGLLNGLYFAQVEKGKVSTEYVGKTYSTKENLKSFDGDTLIIASEIIKANVPTKPANELECENYLLPVIKLFGDTTGMTKKVSKELQYEFKNAKGLCTVKWQGSSSIAYPKKNYTIEFDNPISGKETWGLHTKYCLKANYIDFSHARNIVSAKLWGQIVKSRNPQPAIINSLPNGGAVDGFPIMLFINNTYQGLYTFSIPKDAWLLNMGSRSTEYIVGLENFNFNALPVFDEDETQVAIEYNGSTDDSNVVTSFNHMVQSILDADSNWETSVGQYLDIQSVIDYYIFSTLIGNTDGMGRNALFCTHDGVKWFITAYDMDSTYGNHPDGKGYYIYDYAPSINSWASGNKLMNLAKTYSKEKIKSRFEEIRYSVMSEGNLQYEFLNYCKDIPKGLLDEEVKIWKDIPSTNTNNIYQIFEYYRLRFETVARQISSL